jgi:disulfide bond formation protein DsbB
MDLTFTMKLLTLLCLTSQIVLVVCLILLCTSYKKKVLQFVKDNASILVTIIAVVSMLGSLYLSEVALLAPCVLCWYQRIAMYPIAVLMLVALFRKKTEALLPSMLVLSVVGSAIALYHYVLQLGQHYGFASSLGSRCGAPTGGVSCSKAYFIDFGYITIAHLALTAFVLISLILITKLYDTQTQ